jgi:hypothetical protein
LRKHLPGVNNYDGGSQRHNQAADHQGLFSGKVRQTRVVRSDAHSQWAFLRFLPTLNNPSIGAAPRRMVARQGKNSLRILAL